MEVYRLRVNIFNLELRGFDYAKPTVRLRCQMDIDKNFVLCYNYIKMV